MPEIIKENLFNMEKTILLYDIWMLRDNEMLNALKSFNETRSCNENYEKVMCRRLMSHSATRVKEVCRVIDLSE